MEDPASSPGRTNNHPLADLISRKKKVVNTEWTLFQTVFDPLYITWGRPNVDLFVTRLSNRLRATHGRSTGSRHRRTVDSTERDVCIRIPPFMVLGRVLEKIQQDDPRKMILVAQK